MGFHDRTDAGRRLGRVLAHHEVLELLARASVRAEATT